MMDKKNWEAARQRALRRLDSDQAMIDRGIRQMREVMVKQGLAVDVEAPAEKDTENGD